METKKSVKVTWMGLHNKEEGTHTFLMAKTAPLHEVIDSLTPNVRLTKDGSRKIRLLEVPATAGGKTIAERTPKSSDVRATMSAQRPPKTRPPRREMGMRACSGAAAVQAEMMAVRTRCPTKKSVLQ